MIAERVAFMLGFYLLIVFSGAVIIFRGLAAGDFRNRPAEKAVFVTLWTLLAWPLVWLYFTVADLWSGRL